MFKVNFIQIPPPGDELLVWYGKEYAAELGILFEEEDEVATVPTNQQDYKPSFDDIEEISLEEVDRILQQKAATTSASQQISEAYSPDEQQTDRQEDNKLIKHQKRKF